MKAWFLSDLHLKTVNERNGNILLRFFSDLIEGRHEATHLFLLGDIFDFWVGDHPYYAEKFSPFVEKILEIQKRGIQVFYVEGNHDVHVLRFWKRLGVETTVEDRYLELAGQILRISHGDLINPDDHKYLRYREFIRRWYMEKLAHLLPAQQLESIGKLASLRSRRRSVGPRLDRTEELRAMIRLYAEKCYREKPYDLLVTGHMHVLDDWTVPGTPARSINLGSWWKEARVFWWTGTESGWLDPEKN